MTEGLTTKEKEAAELVGILETVIGDPNIDLAQKAKFLTGLYTQAEIEEFLKRAKIREELLRQMKEGGAISFAEAARVTGASAETVQRVWRAMRDEYPVAPSATNDVCIALPKETRAFDMVERLFALAGFEVTRNGNDAGQIVDMQNGMAPVSVRFLRGEDVITYLNAGSVDAACFGNDKIEETRAEEHLLGRRQANIETFARLEANSFRLCVAIPQEKQKEAGPKGFAFLQGKNIATSYDNFLQAWLDQQGIQATILKIKGGVESVPKDLGADAILDVVQSGASLKRNNLVTLGAPILTGEISLFGLEESNLAAAKRARLEQLCARFRKAGLPKAAA